MSVIKSFCFSILLFFELIWSSLNFFVLITIIAAIVTIIVFVVFLTTATPLDDLNIDNMTEQRRRGAVVTNGYEAAEVGALILKKGGSAVDAAIAAQLCEGIAMPHATGIGGGFFMTIYSKSTRTIETLNSREVAPSLASRDMYVGNTEASSKGGLAIAVPGEIRGLWAAHKRFGRLPWKTILEPAINLCFEGNYVTPALARLLKQQESKLRESCTLKEIFINPKTNLAYIEGDRILRTKLGETLQIIANEGADALYNGSLTQQFVCDIRGLGGIITVEDINNYQPEWLEPITAKLPNDYTLYTMPLPGSGVVLAFILNILNTFLDKSDPESVRNYQRIIESFKFGYGMRSELGDMKFVDGMDEIVSNLTSPVYAEQIRSMISDSSTFNNPDHYHGNAIVTEDHGTAHLCILSPDGDAVSITSTINLNFGAYIRSRNTGIILNNQMDDFSTPNLINAFNLPPSPANYIAPGKRPLSSMCPSIIIDKCGNVKLIIGGAGGSKITTSVALITARHLWFGYCLKNALDRSRIHHQLFPMSILAEHDFDENILLQLHEFGHDYTLFKEVGFAALTAISTENGTIQANFDVRRSGSVAYL